MCGSQPSAKVEAPYSLRRSTAWRYTFHRNTDSKGLGLFITKNQIEAMGGTISVESQVDEVTTFVITLPNEKR